MPPASRGASGRGLALRMLLPVGIIVPFVAHRTLMRVRADVCAHIVHAHDAQRTVLGSANVIVHVISAANAAAGARGFSRVVLSGAHAYIVTHQATHCKSHGRNFFNNTAGPPLRGASRLARHCRSRASHRAHISPHPALASQSLSASQSSRLIWLAASVNASLLALRSASSCASYWRLNAATCSSRSISRFASSHIGQRLSV